MATSVNTEEHLKCAVCLGRFQNPKVLSCQHLYCARPCLEGLVKRVGREDFEITCPLCRRKTRVPNGDVSGLPCNYVINNLLSKQSYPVPSCKKHDGELLKILCQSCDKLICHICKTLDHGDHTGAYIKEIFPVEKEKVLKTLRESRVNMRCLELSIKIFEEQEQSLNKNFLGVNQKLDSFIDRQIELLQRERQKVKDKLRESVLTQKDNIIRQKESFQSSLDCLKNSVQCIEQDLSKRSEVEILSAKNQMIQQLTEINSATADLKPRGEVTYDLEADPLVDEKTVRKIATIREYDEEYKLTIVPGLGFHPRTGMAAANAYAESLSRAKSLWKEAFKMAGFPNIEKNPEQETLKSRVRSSSTFYIRSKRRNPIHSLDNKVQVKLKLPYSDNVHYPNIESGQDGSFSFRYYPEKSGDYKIEVIINGRYLHGNPFTWEVYTSLDNLHQP